MIGPDAMIFIFWMWSFKPAFLLSFTFIKKFFSSSLLSALKIVSPVYLRLLIFLLTVLIPACAHPAWHFARCLPISGWNVLLVSLIFLTRSLVFPILLFSSISLHWSLRMTFLSLLAILWNSAFKWDYLSFFLLPFTSLLLSAICKASSDNLKQLFAFLFLVGGLDHCLLYNVMNLGWTIVHQAVSWTIVLQAVLSIRPNPLNLSLSLYNLRDLI